MEAATTGSGAANQTVVSEAFAAHFVVQIGLPIHTEVWIVQRVGIIRNDGLRDLLPLTTRSLHFLQHMLRLCTILLTELFGHNGHLLQCRVQHLIPLRNILA